MKKTIHFGIRQIGGWWPLCNQRPWYTVSEDWHEINCRNCLKKKPKAGKGAR